MILRNNNREIIRELARINSKENAIRNRIFIVTIAVAFMIIFFIFSMLHTEYDTSNVGNARFNGEVTTLKLLNPTKAQEAAIKALPYVTHTATEWDLGFGFIDHAEKVRCKYIDKDGFKDQYDLAMTHIEGHYPKKKSEIMLSRRTLTELGISAPKLGAEIPIERNGKKDFILSGYFTDYAEYLLPTAFLSKAYLDSIPDPKSITRNLIIYDTSPPSKPEVQARICDALGIKNDGSQLIGEGSYYRSGWTDNSYLGYIFMAVMTLACAYFLINSSLSVTLNKDMRDYGLLKTLGATNPQLWKILLRQILRCSLAGIAIGICGGILLVVTLLPFLTEALYLIEAGPYPALRALMPQYLLISILLTFIMSVSSSLSSLRRIAGLSPMDAKRKAQNVRVRGSVSLLPRVPILSKLAVRRWTKARSNYFSISIPLILSILFILCVITWTKGTYGALDGGRLYDEPDFSITPNNVYFLNEEKNYHLLDPGLEKQFTRMQGVTEADVIYGEYPVLNPTDEAWAPLLSAAGRESGDYSGKPLSASYRCAAIIFDSKKTRELEEYLADKSIALDMEAFTTGRGIICLNAGKLKGSLKAEGREAQGSTVHLSTRDRKKTRTYTFLGYLRRSANVFSGLGAMMITDDTPLILLSEEGFHRLGMKKLVQKMELYADERQEPRIKNRIKNKINQKNLQTSLEVDDPPDKRPHYIAFQATSDMEAIYRKMDDGMRVIVGGVTFSIIILILVQYCSILITNLIFRSRELNTFNALGMTDKQIVTLLRREGLVFGLTTVLLLFTAGSGLICIFGHIAALYREYFTFAFPWKEMLAAGGLLLIMAAVLPTIVYRIRRWRITFPHR